MPPAAAFNKDMSQALPPLPSCHALGAYSRHEYYFDVISRIRGLGAGRATAAPPHLRKQVLRAESFIFAALNII